ncbi:MAG: ABC transporter ATP-binding protein [Blastocatellia bacterium]
MNDSVIDTRGLRKRYGVKVAVEDLTLSVCRGEVFGFLGPNGAGKTTSVKMLLGLAAPTAGSATVLGKPIGDRASRARIGFLPEHFRFHEWLTGREFLRLHGRLHGMPGRLLDERIPALLRRVDLEDAADRRVHGYSKGMIQRIGIAQALINAPELVLLDEPTSGLDPIGRLLVRDIIAELKSLGTTVFLNSHLLSEVEVTCDRVAFVKRGRVLREMSLQAADDAVEVEIRLDSHSEEIVRGLGGFGRGVAVDGDLIRMTVASEDAVPEIASWLVGRGARIYRLASGRKSLEQLFLEIIGEDERAG